jgi:hypothetical protein
MSEADALWRICFSEGEFCRMMAPGQPEQASLSRTEIVQAIRGLPEAGWHRLRKIALNFARNCPT